MKTFIAPFFFACVLGLSGCANNVDPVKYASEHPSKAVAYHRECDPKLAKYQKWIEMGKNEGRAEAADEEWKRQAEYGLSDQGVGKVKWRRQYVPSYQAGGVQYGGKYESIQIAQP